MQHSFKALQESKIDDIFIGLAKLGLIASLGYGLQNMTAHNLQQSGTQVEYRRKEEEVEEKAEARRLLRQKFKEADKCKLGREKARAARKAKLMKQYREVFSQYPTLSYNIN